MKFLEFLGKAINKDGEQDELLAETPVHIPDDVDSELDKYNYFIPTADVNANWTVIDEIDGSTDSSKSYRLVCLAKDLSAAVILRHKPHQNENSTFRIYGRIVFERAADVKIDIDDTEFSKIGGIKPALQIAGADTLPEQQGNGYGRQLYQSLTDKGYTLISDSTEYNGGKRLSRSVAKNSSALSCNVYIFTKGKLLMMNGKPFIYNGSNLPDDKLWSTDPDMKHATTLFITKKK